MEYWKWLKMVVVALIMLGEGWRNEGCLEEERLALFQLKPFFPSIDSRIDGPWYDPIIEEKETSSDCCEWENIECSSITGRVTHLFLNLMYTPPTSYDLVYPYHRRTGNNEYWYLNTSLFLPFEELQSLFLSENSIVGFVDNQGFEKLSSKLNKLEILDLSYNYFNDSILTSLSKLSSLKSLNLAGNNFIGSNPIDDKEQLRLDKLEVLGISNNLLNSSVFSSLAPLSNLKSLYLSYNNLKGPIHMKDLNAFTYLEKLILSYNEVTEFIPSQGILNLFLTEIIKSMRLGNNEAGLRLMNLTVLRLSGNLFNNTILSSLGTLSNLKTLSLGGSNLEGTIDIKELDGLSNLEDLYMTCYSIELQNLTNLEELKLWDSSAPFNFIGALPSLKRLEVGSSNVSDSLFVNDPLELQNLEFMQNLTNLEELILWESSLPFNFIGALPSLKRLEVEWCNVSDNLFMNDPLELQNLESMYIEDTSLENNFLHKIGAMPSIKQLSLTGCGLNGTLHTQGFCGLTNLRFLDMSNNNLKGTLPECFYNFTSLESLDLSSNQLSGDVSALKSLTSLVELRLSNNYFKIPSSLEPFFNLSKLKHFNADNNTIYIERHFELPFLPHTDLSYLDVSKNSFYGNLTIDIGEKLPSLSFLNMSKNLFWGSIPSSIGDMNFLEALDLSNNQLSDGLPEHLTMGCFSLTSLALSNNKLQGQMFSSNVNLTKLRELHLDGNHFSGKIPDSLSNCSFLSTLDLSNNVLSGEIPRWMENMSSLSTLDLSNNELSGDIPRWMGSMSYLEEIVMANNHLEGPFPKEFCHLNDLQLLDLSVNNISGSLPSCFSPLRISQVYLSRNKLEGALTNVFHNSTSLVTLDLSNNHLTGKIPRWIGNLSQLSFLLLNNNHFEGGIPIQLCNLGQLSLINLSNNNLSGTIPSCLKITAMNEISQEYVRYVPGTAQAPSSFSIDEPVEFTVKSMSYSYKGIVLTCLSGIDLSCNKLTGEIPSEVKNLRNIYALNLSHNNLIGPIPLAFSNLKQIESLDLSHNNLSGKIPPQLVGLYRLSYFSVAYNNLSGSTPAWTAQFATFDESRYVGNPLLCGKPLKDCSTSGPSASLLPKASTENGLIDMISFYVTFVVSYVMAILSIACVLYINPYWRQAWFYYVGAISNCCYYFLEDHILPKRLHCGNM
ncbi:hypothetical protein Gotur_035579 [Gossypium turneri]